MPPDLLSEITIAIAKKPVKPRVKLIYWHLFWRFDAGVHHLAKSHLCGIEPLWRKGQNHQQFFVLVFQMVKIICGWVTMCKNNISVNIYTVIYVCVINDSNTSLVQRQLQLIQ